MTTEFGQSPLRRVFAAFPADVAAVAAWVEGRPSGLAADSIVSTSLVSTSWEIR